MSILLQLHQELDAAVAAAYGWPADLPTTTKAAKATAKELLSWPKTLAEQAQAVQRALQQHERPATGEVLYGQFKPAGKGRGQLVQEIDGLLQTLHALGLVRKTEEAEYVR